MKRMRRRKSLRLLGNSLLLELPLSVLESCQQLNLGNSLELHGSAERSDQVAEGIKLCITKAADSICFELKAAQVGQAFEEVLCNSWKCVITQIQENLSSKETYDNAENKIKKECSGDLTAGGDAVQDIKCSQDDTKKLSSPCQMSSLANVNVESNSAAVELKHSASVQKNMNSEQCPQSPSPPLPSEQEGGGNGCLAEDTESFSCQTCGKDFASSKKPRKSLVLHQTRYCRKQQVDSKENTPVQSDEDVKHRTKNGHSANTATLRSRTSTSYRTRRITKKMNQCSYCKQTFTSRITRSRHETFVCSRNPGVIKPHTCKICRRPFRTAAKLSEHTASKHRDGKPCERERECELCGMVFKRANSLYVHKRTAHMIKEPRYRCPHCGKAFHFKDPYNMHVATHSEERPQLCPNCGKQFKNRDQLLKHRNRIHLNKWPYRCPKCGHGMDTKKSLSTHQCHRARRNPDGSHKPNKYPKKLPKKNVPTETPPGVSPEKPSKLEVVRVSCSICGQKRKNNETLLKHVNQTHTNEPKYDEVLLKLNELVRVTCDVCKKEFRNAKTLREHTQNVHATDECQCHYCDKLFRTASHVKAHIKNVHQATSRKYTCDQCSNMFKSRKNLVWHIRYQHMKLERKYKCPQCDFKYAFDKQYYEHRTRVHGPKKQECPWCGYRCATRWYMNKHMKNCARGHEKYHGQDAASSQEVTVPAEVDAIEGKPIDDETKFCDSLVQLEGGQVIIDEKPIAQKQLLEQLASGNVLPDSSDEKDQYIDMPVGPLEQHTIIELPASWNEKTIPDNVSVEEITYTNQPTEQVIAGDVSQYCIIEEDGNKQIIQLVYADMTASN